LSERDEGEGSDWLHCRFDTRMMPPKKAVLGQLGKAVGCASPTALLFEQAASIQDQQNQTLNQHNCGHACDGKD
jgi:hypothetical protein